MSDPAPRTLIDYQTPPQAGRRWGWYLPPGAAFASTLVMGALLFGGMVWLPKVSLSPATVRLLSLCTGVLCGGWLLNAVFLVAGIRLPRDTWGLLSWLICFLLSMIGIFFGFVMWLALISGEID